jgi:hypothetical protein
MSTRAPNLRCWPSTDAGTKTYVLSLLTFLELGESGVQWSFEAIKQLWQRDTKCALYRHQSYIFDFSKCVLPTLTETGHDFNKTTARSLALKCTGTQKVGGFQLLIRHPDYGRKWFVRHALAHVSMEAVLRIAPSIYWNVQAALAMTDEEYEVWTQTPMVVRKGRWSQKRLEMHRFGEDFALKYPTCSTPC